MNEKILSIIIKAQDEASKVFDKVGDKMEASVDASRKFAAGMAVVGTAAAGASVYAVKSAADFEQSLNVMRSVSGATGEQMVEVAAKARALGKDITLPGISAKDAAMAMVELSKAGLSVNDTLAASHGVLSLAKAGQLDTARAAEITANALNAFSLKGSEATRIADLLAAAANASSAGVDDLALGMQMSSASAAALKIPLQDLVTGLAMMANNGIKGSDAGTSLKTMMMALTPTTDKAREAMNQLGLKFFDAEGRFVGMRSVAEQLRTATAGLTDQQKAMTLETIFGSDAVRAATILAKEGAVGFDQLSGAVNKQGAAALLAAAQNSGFKGALDNIRSTIETLATDIGMKMLPALTTLATMIARNIEPVFMAFAGRIGQIGPIVIGVIVGGLIPAFAALGVTIWTALAPILPFIAAGAALAAVINGLVQRVGGWNAVLQQSRGTVQQLWAVVSSNLIPSLSALFSRISGDVIPSLQRLYNIVAPVLVPWLRILATTFGSLLVASMWVSINVVNALWGVLSRLINIVSTVIGWIRNLASVLGTIRGAATAGVSGVSEILSSPFRAALNTIRSIADQISGIVRSITDKVNSARNAASGMVNSIKGRIPGFAEGVRNYSGGLAVVGEKGPELVDLPRGSSVYSNPESRAMLGGRTINFYGNITLSTPESVDRFADRFEMAQLGVGV